MAMGLETEVGEEDLYPGKSQLRRVIDFLEYWIAMIVTYAKGEQASFPRIVLIGTHKDQITDFSRLEIIKRGIKHRFSDFITSSQLVIHDDLFICAKNMSSETRKSIRKIILAEGMKYPGFGKEIPASWIDLQERLLELREKKHYIVKLV